LSRIKTLNGLRVRRISPVGDSEDGEEDDDELPCVIGENEGDCI